MPSHHQLHRDDEDNHDHIQEEDNQYRLHTVSTGNNHVVSMSRQRQLTSEEEFNSSEYTNNSYSKEEDDQEENKTLTSASAGGLFHEDQPLGGRYSLPATPTPSRNLLLVVKKDYESENEAAAHGDPAALNQQITWKDRTKSRRRKRRDITWRYREFGGPGDSNPNDDPGNNNYKETVMMNEHTWKLISKESDGQEGGRPLGGGLVVITRPKGGSRSLCMDLEEVKACHDLGFELEDCQYCCPTILDPYSSIAGDDSRDVKARLKVWAQAVALASSSTRHPS